MSSPIQQAPNIAALVERLQTGFATGESAGDNTEPLRYVIYARKSTDTTEKQERSIGDQVFECRAIAERLGLRYTAVIHEEQSAMISDKRPKFRSMLDDLKAGKYDGIITWAPDRLARNMKEAGEIIDMVDHGVIKDVKFANNFVFTNDPSGKMLLSIAFTMAKQFSDQHSQNVTRAIRRKTAEGKWAGSRGKHGYYKDAGHYLRPDGENFDTIVEMFKMRLAKKSLLDIAAYLKDRGFPMATKNTKHRKLVIDEQFISGLLRDPLYAGALVFGKHVENLLEKDPGFVPAVSVEDFDAIFPDGVGKGGKLAGVIKEPGSVKANLLRGLVTCGRCNRAMSTGVTPKYDPSGNLITSYFYFRCDTSDCVFKGKSVRAKTILAAVYKLLENHPLITEAGYRRYIAEMRKQLGVQEVEVERELKSLQTQKRHAETRAEDVRGLLRGEEDAVLKRDYKADLKNQLAKIKVLETQIAKLKASRINGSDAILSVEQFHELFGNLAGYIKKIPSMADLDFILRKIFSNFVILDKKVEKIEQTSPFRELFETKTTARDERSPLVTPGRIELPFGG